jgi:ectoine hydroxylase-related dioxygenase (phytanoyl-CoA dioxygenase family)
MAALSLGRAEKYRLGEVVSVTPRSLRDPGPEAIEAFDRDGVVCLRGAFSSDWVAQIESGMDEAIKNPTKAASTTVNPNEPGFFFYDTMMWKRLPVFRKFVFDSHAPDLFMPFLDTTKLVFYYDFLIVKAPRSDSASTPWHHDVSYYPFDGRKMMNCWTALDEIPLDTSLRFWRGSHKLQQVYRAKHFDPNKKYANLMMERPLPPDIEADPLAYDIISCGMQPGDTLIFSSRTVHSAPGNFREKRRAALSTNWLGDDVTYFDLPQQMDPPDRGEGLVDGGPVECASFPRVR